MRLFRKELIKEFQSRGYRVVCYGPVAGDVETAEICRELGITYKGLRLSRKAPGVFGELLLMRALRGLLREVNPEFCLVFGLRLIVVSSLVAYVFPGLRLISVVTGLGTAFGVVGYQSLFLRTAINGVIRASMRRNELVVFQNPDDENEFLEKKLIRSRNCSIVVNGSGVDLDYFKPYALPSSSVTFVFVGRFLRSKGILLFLEAARRVLEVEKDASFLAIGRFEEGHRDAVTSDEVDPYFREPQIEMVNWVSDVRGHLARSSVIVLPSSYREGVPRSIIEAMAMGRPVITCDTPGCRMTVTAGRNGILIPSGDIEALEKALLSFLDDQTEMARMGIESRRMAEELFDVKEVNRKLVGAVLRGVEEKDSGVVQ